MHCIAEGKPLHTRIYISEKKRGVWMGLDDWVEKVEFVIDDGDDGGLGEDDGEE